MISELIAKYRTFIGYTDEQLIQLTGIDKERFCKIIDGIEQPYLKQIMSISDVLKVPLRYFMDPSLNYQFQYHVCLTQDVF